MGTDTGGNSVYTLGLHTDANGVVVPSQYEALVGATTYTFVGVHANHPMKIYDADATSVPASGCEPVLNASDGGTVVDGVYCHGRCKWTIPLECANRRLSLRCAYHGFMGGFERLRVDTACVSAALGNMPSVLISNGRLYVNGAEMHLWGVNWQPNVNGTFGYAIDAATADAEALIDAPQIGAAGFNVIKSYRTWDSTGWIDRMYESGVYTVTGPIGAGDVTEAQLRALVQSLKNAPGLLFWAVGNEWNYNQLYRGGHGTAIMQSSEDILFDWCTIIKEEDPSRPVVSVFGAPHFYYDQPAGNSPVLTGAHWRPTKLDTCVDGWGFNIYNAAVDRATGEYDGTSTFGMEGGKDGLTGQPGGFHDYPANVFRFVGEYGMDAFNRAQDVEDTADQADATRNMLRALYHTRDYSGGFLFEWQDEWWKDQTGSLTVHDKDGWSPGDITCALAPCVYSEEWWGLVDADHSPRPALTTWTQTKAELLAAPSPPPLAPPTECIPTENACCSNATDPVGCANAWTYCKPEYDWAVGPQSPHSNDVMAACNAIAAGHAEHCSPCAQNMPPPPPRTSTPCDVTAHDPGGCIAAWDVDVTADGVTSSCGERHAWLRANVAGSTDAAACADIALLSTCAACGPPPPPPPPPAPLTPGACAAYPACVAAGLQGACCPTPGIDGIDLGCCTSTSASAPPPPQLPVSSPPPPAGPSPSSSPPPPSTPPPPASQPLHPVADTCYLYTASCSNPGKAASKYIETLGRTSSSGAERWPAGNTDPDAQHAACCARCSAVAACRAFWPINPEECWLYNQNAVDNHCGAGGDPFYVMPPPPPQTPPPVFPPPPPPLVCLGGLANSAGVIAVSGSALDSQTTGDNDFYCFGEAANRVCLNSVAGGVGTTSNRLRVGAGTYRFGGDGLVAHPFAVWGGQDGQQQLASVSQPPSNTLTVAPSGPVDRLRCSVHPDMVVHLAYDAACDLAFPPPPAAPALPAQCCEGDGVTCSACGPDDQNVWGLAAGNGYGSCGAQILWVKGNTEHNTVPSACTFMATQTSTTANCAACAYAEGPAAPPPLPAAPAAPPLPAAPPSTDCHKDTFNCPLGLGTGTGFVDYYMKNLEVQELDGTTTTIARWTNSEEQRDKCCAACTETIGCEFFWPIDPTQCWLYTNQIVDAAQVHFHPAEPVGHLLADRAIVPRPHGHQAFAHVGPGADTHAQAVARVLMNEAPVGTHQQAAFSLAELIEVAHGAVAHAVFDGAGGRSQPGRQAVEQSGLAGSALADDGENFARPELEGHVPAADAVAVVARDAVDLKQRVIAEKIGHRVGSSVRSADVPPARVMAFGSAAMGPRCPASRRSSQKSLSEQTNMRPPLSSRMTSSR